MKYRNDLWSLKADILTPGVRWTCGFLAGESSLDGRFCILRTNANWISELPLMSPFVEHSTLPIISCLNTIFFRVNHVSYHQICLENPSVTNIYHHFDTSPQPFSWGVVSTPTAKQLRNDSKGPGDALLEADSVAPGRARRREKSEASGWRKSRAKREELRRPKYRWDFHAEKHGEHTIVLWIL